MPIPHRKLHRHRYPLDTSIPREKPAKLACFCGETFGGVTYTGVAIAFWLA